MWGKPYVCIMISGFMIFMITMCDWCGISDIYIVGENVTLIIDMYYIKKTDIHEI
jgi:hypothetical protein